MKVERKKYDVTIRFVDDRQTQEFKDLDHFSAGGFIEIGTYDEKEKQWSRTLWSSFLVEKVDVIVRVVGEFDYNPLAEIFPSSGHTEVRPKLS